MKQAGFLLGLTAVVVYGWWLWPSWQQTSPAVAVALFYFVARLDQWVALMRASILRNTAYLPDSWPEHVLAFIVFVFWSILERSLTQ